MHVSESLPTGVCWGAEGKPIPTELRNDEARLRNAVELEDDNTAGS